MNKLVPKKILNTILANQTKIVTGGFFLCVVIFFSLIFLRQDKYVFVRLFLTQREEAKYWSNFPDNFYYRKLQVGLSEKNELGKSIAEVTDVFRTNTTYSNELGIATIKLKANVNKTTGVYSFQGQPLIIGEYQRIRMGSILLQGYLIDISIENEEYKEKVYRVKAIIDDWGESTRGSNDTKVTGVPKEVVMAVENNESVINSHGDVSTRLLNLSYQPAQRVSYTSTGKKTFQDPDLYEGEVELELRTIEIDGTDYWDFVVPMQVGQRFTINFKNTQLPVKIIKIVSAEDV